MEKDNKILFGAILIILIAMLSLNFNNILTGNVSKESVSKVVVSPNEVTRGEVITVEVTPGPEGVYNRWAWIYNAEKDLRLTGTAKRMCGNQAVCYDPLTITYLIEGNEDKFPDGKYVIKVREHDVKETKYAEGVFWIKGYNKK